MKYWKTLMTAALVLGLSACGGGEDSDKNDPPPPTPGDPGSVVFSAKAPTFVPVTLSGTATKDTASTEPTRLAVEFTAKDTQGNPVALNGQQLSFSVTKLMPKRSGTGDSYWKAFIYSSKNGGYRADFEKSSGTTVAPSAPGLPGTLEDLGGGNYRYVFNADLEHGAVEPYLADDTDGDGFIAWDADKTHRLAVTFGSAEDDSTMALVNFTLDWVPSGQPAETRNILEMNSCSNCHMDQPIHHSSRNDPKVCVACHNESNPDYSGRRALATIVHDYHSKPSAMYEKNGAPVVNEGKEAGEHYPQDPRNCDTCHKPATETTPDADNWFTKGPENACEGCHFDSDGQIGEQSYHGEQINGLYTSKDGDRSGCHANSTTKSKEIKNVHMGRLASLQAAADTLKFVINRASYDEGTQQVTADITISEAGVGIEDANAWFAEHAYLTPGLLINWDNGEGNARANHGSTIKLTGPLAGCEAQGGGNFICTSPVLEDAIPDSDATLTVTVSDMGLCGDRKALEAGKTGTLVACDATAAGLAKNQFFYKAAAPTMPVAHFTLSGEPTDGYQVPVGADKDSCSDCHKDFKIHFTGDPAGHLGRDFNQCTSCHNAKRAAFYPGEPGDLKHMVHQYHDLGSGHGGGSAFPGPTNNCKSCHSDEQYNIPNQKNTRPSLVDKLTKADDTTKPGDQSERAPKYYSPTLVVCASCHMDVPVGDVMDPSNPPAGGEWASHMQDNGAVFGADTAELATGTEQCDSCHAIGQEQGVDKVHKVFDFR